MPSRFPAFDTLQSQCSTLACWRLAQQGASSMRDQQQLYLNKDMQGNKARKRHAKTLQTGFAQCAERIKSVPVHRCYSQLAAIGWQHLRVLPEPPAALMAYPI